MKMKKEKSGFTLVEVILVIAMIGLLGVIALSSYFNSIATFRYFQNYRSISSTMRLARQYAITNASYLNDEGLSELPGGYGIYIDKQADFTVFRMFVDDGIDPLQFDGEDSVIEEKTFTFENVDYELKAYDSQLTPAPLKYPLSMTYQIGTGELYAFQTDVVGDFELIPKSNPDYKFIALEFRQLEDAEISRYVIVYQVSGLPEEAVNIP